LLYGALSRFLRSLLLLKLSSASPGCRAYRAFRVDQRGIQALSIVVLRVCKAISLLSDFSRRLLPLLRGSKDVSVLFFSARCFIYRRWLHPNCSLLWSRCLRFNQLRVGPCLEDLCVIVLRWLGAELEIRALLGLARLACVFCDGILKRESVRTQARRLL
jgi:hypothetical protein